MRRSETVAAHSVEKNSTVPKSAADPQRPGTRSKWTRGGEPIDTSAFDAGIAAAEKKVRASGNASGEKKQLSRAYFKRAYALTEARQYAAAIGDYRRAAKIDPENREAKEWVEKIIMIYEGLNRDYPKEGEEPKPLEFKKGRDRG